MGVEVSRLSNGLTVATETLPRTDSVAIGTWVKSGARTERDDEHGMAHPLDHVAVKGPRQRRASQTPPDSQTAGVLEDTHGEPR